MSKSLSTIVPVALTWFCCSLAGYDMVVCVCCSSSVCQAVAKAKPTAVRRSSRKLATRSRLSCRNSLHDGPGFLKLNERKFFSPLSDNIILQTGKPNGQTIIILIIVNSKLMGTLESLSYRLINYKIYIDLSIIQ